MENLTSWAQAERQRLADAQEKTWQEKGFKPFMKLEIGKNTLEFEDAPPRTSPAMPGKAIFRANRTGKAYDLPIRLKSPLYRELVKALAEGRHSLTIARTGKGRLDTKYTIE